MALGISLLVMPMRVLLTSLSLTYRVSNVKVRLTVIWLWQDDSNHMLFIPQKAC